MYINSAAKLYGIIGDPVAHSLSPLLHNTLAARMGHQMMYTTFPVPGGKVSKLIHGVRASVYDSNLELSIHGAYALGIAGMNVTSPYKSAIIPYLAALDGTAAKIGVVNTIVRGEKGFIGYNTDNIGLYRAMQSESLEIKGADIVILGAGGAGRAAAFLCVEKEARNIFILNRTANKAASLAKEVNDAMQTNCLSGMGLSDFKSLPRQNLIAIQSTSIGMHPYENEAPINDSSFYERIAAGIDMIYNPAETIFMKNLKKAGGKAVNGLKMLLYQGIAAYELWNQEAVPDKYIDMVYKELINASKSKSGPE